MWPKHWYESFDKISQNITYHGKYHLQKIPTFIKCDKTQFQEKNQTKNKLLHGDYHIFFNSTNHFYNVRLQKTHLYFWSKILLKKVNIQCSCGINFQRLKPNSGSELQSSEKYAGQSGGSEPELLLPSNCSWRSAHLLHTTAETILCMLHENFCRQSLQCIFWTSLPKLKVVPSIFLHNYIMIIMGVWIK